MEETPVCAASDLIDDVGLEVDVERTRHVLSGGGLREKGAEAIIMGTRRTLDQTTIGLYTNVRQDSNAETRRKAHTETVLDGIQLPYVIGLPSAF